MTDQKELAFRYDLFIASDWRDRFDTLISENIELPLEGRFLDVNCGTGAYTIALAEQLKGKGEVVGFDEDAERINIAREKNQVQKTKDVRFEEGSASNLPLKNDEFDVVIGDTSLLHSSEINDVLAEMVRVARPQGQVVLKLVTYGSFDEFSSIYWEALHDVGIDEKVWTSLEHLIKERTTVSTAEALAEHSGLSGVESFVRKEEFQFGTAKEFLESPLISDWFLSDWLEIIPAESREAVMKKLISIIERERNNAPFEVSIKATVIVGRKNA
jgi:ubiquinone/menaquinone biosynthesis C-methylase UbiE